MVSPAHTPSLWRMDRKTARQSDREGRNRKVRSLLQDQFNRIYRHVADDGCPRLTIRHESEEFAKEEASRFADCFKRRREACVHQKTSSTAPHLQTGSPGEGLSEPWCDLNDTAAKVLPIRAFLDSRGNPVFRANPREREWGNELASLSPLKGHLRESGTVQRKPELQPSN